MLGTSGRNTDIEKVDGVAARGPPVEVVRLAQPLGLVTRPRRRRTDAGAEARSNLPGAVRSMSRDASPAVAIVW